MSFAKNMSKNLSNKYNQKLIASAKKSGADAIKATSKRAIQKNAETTGDIIGNKIADKITKSSRELHSKELNPKTDENEIETTKERYIPL